MSSKAATVTDYPAELDPARRSEIEAVRDLVNKALPAGYREDMGKSCIRFRRASDLALDVLQGEIASTPPADFIALYERVKPR